MTCGNITFSIIIDFYNNRLKSLRESVIKCTNDPNAMHDGFCICILYVYTALIPSRLNVQYKCARTTISYILIIINNTRHICVIYYYTQNTIFCFARNWNYYRKYYNIRKPWVSEYCTDIILCILCMHSTYRLAILNDDYYCPDARF